MWSAGFTVRVLESPSVACLQLRDSPSRGGGGGCARPTGLLVLGAGAGAGSWSIPAGEGGVNARPTLNRCQTSSRTLLMFRNTLLPHMHTILLARYTILLSGHT